MAAKTAVSKTRRVPVKAADPPAGKAATSSAKRGAAPMRAPATRAASKVVAKPAAAKSAVRKPVVAKSVAPVRTRAEPSNTAARVVPAKPAARMPATARKTASRAAVATVAVPQQKVKPARVAVTPRRPPAPTPKAKPLPPAGRSAVPAVRVVKTRGGTKSGAKRRVRYVAPALREVKVKELDPVARCGPDTSVELLYRVDERLDGRAADVHLVFFDRYGWYCVHGRGCAAVADVHQDLRAQRRSVPRLATTTRALGR